MRTYLTPAGEFTADTTLVWQEDRTSIYLRRAPDFDAATALDLPVTTGQLIGWAVRRENDWLVTIRAHPANTTTHVPTRDRARDTLYAYAIGTLKAVGK